MTSLGGLFWVRVTGETKNEIRAQSRARIRSPPEADERMSSDWTVTGKDGCRPFSVLTPS